MLALIHAQATDFTIIQMDSAAISNNQADNHIKTGRFASPIGAEQANSLSALNS